MFIKKGKTNWKFISIVFVLAILVGGLTFWQYREIQKEEFRRKEVSIPRKVTEDEISFPDEIISQLNDIPEFITWFEGWQKVNPSLEIRDFSKIDIGYKKALWTNFAIREEKEINTPCSSNTYINSREVYSPDGTKYIYFPCYVGQVDTDIWLYNRKGDKKIEMLDDTGPSGWFEDAFWLDSNYFVIVSYSKESPTECGLGISYWNLPEEKTISYPYQIKPLNCKK